MRNLDMTALRAFVTVADTGGVTRASGFLNLTQSAVSMQLKRLEESVGVSLLDRSARKLALTRQGEQMLSYARRMLSLNDEAMTRLTAQDYEGQLALGVPSDIIYPAIPQVLQRFNATFPRMKVQLVSSFTSRLRRMLERGEVNLTLATEPHLDSGGETLLERPLVWVGAIDGQQWRARPLRLAFEEMCIFRHAVQRELDRAGIPWEMAVESDNTRTIEATISADLAVNACIEGAEPRYVAQLRHGGALPDLPQVKINMYGADLAKSEPEKAMVEFVRQAFATL
ncbi:LysR family transcriptional regulator [Alterinioella nitratireducens]|jgi:DNA-binding transcriptional LysR family regulator|uniref:LysR family transcriptional regulator n=1 Tax=Alterinioella nitratireducens TaxID=2735915 RepID=UPI000C460CB0|nr:LysR family transcriptional regulator [Alterinioella nitratireducens]MAN15773.1 LysR family transcriptional regulator [Dinoroseobacter sp.]MAX74801.1 LysR family transcriptional regulator [Nioella sp.]NPD18190.1 LysR family transcriptional regulator [Alterinioella nitratireducens]|tara:strand:- start:31 stop:882 length:852 start_codon:yes stop_codon:yes gene_type:complete